MLREHWSDYERRENKTKNSSNTQNSTGTSLVVLVQFEFNAEGVG